MERRAGFPLGPARPFAFDHNGDLFGWREGSDGHWHLTLRIPAGRIVDNSEVSHLTGLREIAKIHQGEFRMTPNQNLVVAGVPAGRRERIDALVREHALDAHVGASGLRLNALACVSLPTCGLAMAEAERYLPALLDKAEALLARHNLFDAPIHLRISGCPNGCSRPYLGEIALVGKAPGRYNLMLGADHRGQRLNVLHRENIDEAAILSELDVLFARYANERMTNQHFGDFLVAASIITPPSSAAPRPGIAIEVIP